MMYYVCRAALRESAGGRRSNAGRGVGRSGRGLARACTYDTTRQARADSTGEGKGGGGCGGARQAQVSQPPFGKLEAGLLSVKSDIRDSNSNSRIVMMKPILTLASRGTTRGTLSCLASTLPSYVPISSVNTYPLCICNIRGLDTPSTSASSMNSHSSQGHASL